MSTALIQTQIIKCVNRHILKVSIFPHSLSKETQIKTLLLNKQEEERRRQHMTKDLIKTLKI